jgi:lipopolysaccharide/colanic/teichoic acid biosynthesis glycosyltransferase
MLASTALWPRPRSAVPLNPLPRWKRPLDLAVGVVTLVLVAPVMLAAAALVRLSSAGPVLFHQPRIGRGEQPFILLKFRTMYLGTDDRAHRDRNTRELKGQLATPPSGIFKLEDDPRITPAGTLLRRWSVDELPQLFNVLRGEMSLVGPRPSLPWEVELYTPAQRRRHACLPGITGLWQVSGRNRLSMPEMLALDLAYAERCSLRLDLSILLRTPTAVLLDRGTS